MEIKIKMEDGKHDPAHILAVQYLGKLSLTHTFPPRSFHPSPHAIHSLPP